jgi:type IV secretory pathway TraG/TraD family ATPase VirD4
VKASLRIFTDDEVARVSSFDSVSFSELRKTPTVLYIHNSVGDQRYFSTLNAIFFEQLYSFLLSELPHKEALDVFFVLEEASSLYIPLLPLALANLRKYRSGTIVCTQSPSQLKTLYGNDFQNIVTNCQTKIYLAGQTDPDVLHHLETLGGKYVSTDKKGIDRITHLISADEIRLLEKNRSLIVSSNNPLIKGRVSPYYESAKYRSYASIPPLSLVGDVPEESLCLLLYDLEHADKAENQK